MFGLSATASLQLVGLHKVSLMLDNTMPGRAQGYCFIA
jgi:hypothetical protein